MKDQIVQGIDIGGSHITAALVDLKAGSIVPGTLIRQKLNAHGSAEEIIGIWCEVCSGVFEQSPCEEKKLGIAMPGPFDYEHGISLIQNMNKYDSLYGMNIRDILSDRVGIDRSNILFRNDAEAFLHGEVFCGSAKGFHTAIGITLGTGLGSATSINGVTRDEYLAIIPFLNGIAEDYLSTRWFVKRYFEYTGVSIEGVKELSRLPADDPHFSLILEEFSVNLGRFLKEFIFKEKSDIVVLGGNITKMSPVFLQKVEDFLSKHSIRVPLKVSELGEDAALIGAASLWWEKSEQGLNKNIAVNIVDSKVQ